jgi:hypothetical protein
LDKTGTVDFRLFFTEFQLGVFQMSRNDREYSIYGISCGKNPQFGARKDYSTASMQGKIVEYAPE